MVIVSGCIGTKESFLSSVCSWMVQGKTVHSEKFHPLWPILEKRMILKIHPFSCESSFLGRIGWFLVKRMNLNFSCRVITYSCARRMNHGNTGDSWKSSILPRFVWFGLIRLNLEKRDVFTRIVFSQRNVRSGRFSVVMKPSNNIKHITHDDLLLYLLLITLSWIIAWHSW